MTSLAQKVDRVPRQVVSAMVYNCLECPYDADQCGLSIGQPSQPETDRETDAVNWDLGERSVLLPLEVPWDLRSLEDDCKMLLHCVVNRECAQSRRDSIPYAKGT